MKLLLNFTKKMNYKKPNAKNQTKNIKNILRPFIEEKNNDFDSLSEDFKIIKERIKQDFTEKNSGKVCLKYNKIIKIIYFLTINI